MRILQVLQVLLVVVLALSIGCSGDDGSDGKVFLRFDWPDGEAPDRYSDNNEDTPEQIYRRRNYETLPGTYSFSYRTNANRWEGSYILNADPGEEGKMFWRDGENGDDRYYKLWLYETEGPKLERVR